MGVDAQIGDIMVFPYNFAPRGWATCDGQLLAISSNTALFSLLGTTYGGDGRTTFALPNLQGRLPMHAGRGPGLSQRTLGQQGGAEDVALTVDQLAPHSHNVQVVNGPPSATAPSPSVAPSNGQGRGAAIYNSAAGTGALESLEPTPGGSRPHTNMMPAQVMTICIALQGVYPSRS